MDATTAATLLSSAAGENYEFLHRLDGGMVGADLFTDDAGIAWVAKWVNDPGAVERRSAGVVFSERLRTHAGWPNPPRHTVTADDWLFVLQRFVPGDVVDVVTHNLLDSVHAIHERRLGLAESDDDLTGFADHLLETLTVGGTDYCGHQAVSRFSPRSSAFVDRVRAIGAELTVADLSANDVIHWDLHPGNLIERHGQLEAVIDTDHAKAGDARFDLVTLALTVLDGNHDPSVVDRLHSEAIAPLDDATHAGFIGHMILRMLSWTIHRGADGETGFWLDQADRLL